MASLRACVSGLSVMSRSLRLGTTRKTFGSFNQKRLSSHGTWTYRDTPPDPPKLNARTATVCGALMWWWILYHLCTEPEHIFGEWPIVKPAEWTDEELGIPPDDEGLALRIREPILTNT